MIYGIIHINLTKEINQILANIANIANEDNVKSTDNRISWPIRQAITKALINGKLNK